jgi:F0F1-type ATP synthase epsilon subunit
MAKPDTAEQLLEVKVYSPYRTFYKGKAKSISAINATGPFDVLYGHINFFSVLKEGNVAIDTGSETQEIPIGHGILHVRRNQATLFVFSLSTDEAEERAAGEEEDGKPRSVSTRL